jgi:6-phosphogluconolactonase
MTAATPFETEICADPDALARRVADWLLALASEKIGGPFAVALSGGETPKQLYRLLASPEYRGAFPWSRTHWFWGDERFVPPDDPRSNFHMVKDAMLSHAPVPSENIHRMPTEGDPDTAARAYEHTLQAFYGTARLDPARPLFDIVLLGLGVDGHTASLFPGSPVLAERARWVAPVIGAKAEARLTLTYPVLDSTRHAAFIVAGADKREALHRLRHGGDIPAAQVRPVGKLHLFADRAADSSP